MKYVVTECNNFWYILMDSGVFIMGEQLQRAVKSGMAFVEPGLPFMHVHGLHVDGIASC